MPERNPIPELESDTFAEMDRWFGRMADRGLLFHPDDPPETIEWITTGEPMFTAPECRELRRTLDRLFHHHGDRIHDCCAEHMYRLMGIVPA